MLKQKLLISERFLYVPFERWHIAIIHHLSTSLCAKKATAPQKLLHLSLYDELRGNWRLFKLPKQPTKFRLYSTHVLFLHYGHMRCVNDTDLNRLLTPRL